MPPPLQRMRAAGPDRRGLPGADRLPGQPRRRARSRSPTTRWCARRCATAWSRRWTPRGCAPCWRRMADGRIRRSARELPEPSVFAHEILNANPYAFLDDAPLEERRTRAVALRRGLPAAVVERIGGLDPAAIDDGGRRGAARPARRRRAARPAARSGRAARGDRARARAGPSSSRRWWHGRRRRPPRGRRRATGSRPSGARSPRRSGPAAASRPTWSSRRRAGPRRDRRRKRARRDRARSPRAARSDDGGRDRGAGSASARPTSRPRWPASRWRAAVLRGRFVADGRRRGRRPDGAIGACSRASTGTCSTGCAARSSRSAPPTSCASCSAGSTSARAASSTGSRAWRA